jgi:creatinine amidohydrolase
MMARDASSYEVASLTWDRVGERLREGAPAILPIGAVVKENGLHMPTHTDRVFAEHFVRALAEKTDALIWPTLTYGFYPAFVAYAGRASLSTETFKALVAEISDAILRFGARILFILDTGLSTIGPVDEAIQLSRDPSRVRHVPLLRTPVSGDGPRSHAAALREPRRRDRDLVNADDRSVARGFGAGQAVALVS